MGFGSSTARRQKGQRIVATAGELLGSFELLISFNPGTKNWQWSTSSSFEQKISSYPYKDQTLNAELTRAAQVCRAGWEPCLE